MLDNILKESVARGATDVHLKAGRPPYFRSHSDSGYLPVPALDGTDIGELIHRFEENTRTEHRVHGREPLKRYAIRMTGLASMRVEVSGRGEESSISIRLYHPLPQSLGDIELPYGFRRLVESGLEGLLILCGGRWAGLTTTLTAIAQHCAEDGRAGRVGFVSDESAIGLGNDTRGLVRIAPAETMGAFGDILLHATSLQTLIVDQPLSPGQFRQLVGFSGNSHCQVIYVVNGESVVDAIQDCLSQYGEDLHTDSEPIDIKPRELSTRCLARVLNGVLWRDLVVNDERRVLPVYELATITPEITGLIREYKIHQIVAPMTTEPMEVMFTREQYLAGLIESNRLTVEAVLANPLFGRKFAEVYKNMVENHQSGS